MNAAAWTFAVAFGIALVIHFIIRGELDRLYAEVNHLARELRDARRQRDLTEAERDRLAADLRIVRGQRDIADAERAALQARLDGALVIPFGPVQSGVVRRLPRQRNGDAS